MQKLISGVQVNGSSTPINIASISRGNYRTCKVSITIGTGTVALEGRGGPGDATWVTLATFTASGIVGVLLPPQVRVTVSGVASAPVIDVWLDAYMV